MFFGNKNKKVNGQQRFQDRQFTQKLNEARNYKRHARYIPEHPVDLFLSRVGLGTRWTQILAGLVVLGLLYLVYIPNFLSVQQVSVKGLDETNKTIAEGAAKQSISNAPFYNPQNNLIFLSESRIKAAVESVPGVYKVTQVKKDFKSKNLIIEAAPKYERFLVSDGEKVFDIYNEGTLKAPAGIAQSDFAGTSNPSMLKVILPTAVNPQEHERFFSAELVQSLEIIAGGLKDIPASPLKQIFAGMLSTKQILNEDGSTTTETSNELPLPIKSSEIRAELEKNGNPQQTFQVIFDTESDLPDTIKRLNLLLSQTPPDRYKNLYYIDMRLKNRGYICLIGAPCAK